MTTEATTTQGLILTDGAAAKVKDLLDREGTDDPRRSDRHRSRLHDPDPYPDRPDLRYRDRERPRLRYLDREFGLYTRLCG